MPAISAASAAAAFLSGLEAILTIDGAVATRLEGNGGLLAACRTSDAGALRFTAGVSASGTLVILFCLSAILAALRSGVTAFLEICLIVAGKGEFLPAVATSQLQILCHTSLSSTLSLYAMPPGYPRGKLGKGARRAYARQRGNQRPNPLRSSALLDKILYAPCIEPKNAVKLGQGRRYAEARLASQEKTLHHRK